MRLLLVVWLSCWSVDFTLRAEEKSKVSPSPLRVAIYDDAGGGGKGPENLERALTKEHGFATTRVKATDIRAGVLDKFDVVIHPGGSGGGQGRNLEEAGRTKERDFIKAGGGFVGICAGAYLASADYDWSLHVLDAKVLDRAHWARGFGEVELGLAPVGQKLFEAKQEKLPVYYHQGPLLAPAGKDDIPDYEEVATFATEIAKNGAPEGVMKGSTALARGTFGKGRVFCVSPHPEKNENYDETIRRIVRWAGQREKEK
jgi:glutamine amidotransferase-like uncharacterized protein